MGTGSFVAMILVVGFGLYWGGNSAKPARIVVLGFPTHKEETMRGKWPLLIGILLTLSSLACNLMAAGEEVDESTPTLVPPTPAEDSATAGDLELQEARSAEVVDDRPA